MAQAVLRPLAVAAALRTVASPHVDRDDLLARGAAVEAKLQDRVVRQVHAASVALGEVPAQVPDLPVAAVVGARPADLDAPVRAALRLSRRGRGRLGLPRSSAAPAVTPELVASLAGRAGPGSG